MAEIAKITLKGESEAKNFIDEALRGDIAYEELSTTVSKAGGYVAGDHLIYLGQYYEVVADIAQGGTIVTSGAGQNVEEREVGDEIKKNKTQVLGVICDVETSPATAAHSAGDQFYYDGALVEATSAIAIGDTIVVSPDTGYNVKVADKVVAQIQTLTNQVTDISEVMGKNGAKNKEPFDIDVVKALNTTGTWTGNSYALNGITFAFADDGKVTVSGTASALCSINISGNYDLNGDYIITGCPSGGGSSTYSLRIYDSSATVVADDIGEGISFTANNLANCRTNIIVRTNVAISTPIVFAPMIRDSKDTDPTYQPYAKSNKVLTDNIKSIYEDNGLLGAKNLLPTPYYSTKGGTTTSGTLTVTENADGSVTIDGTASARSYIDLARNDKFLKAGTYILSGGLTSKQYVYINCLNNGTYVRTLVSAMTSEAEFVLDYNGYDAITVGMSIASGESLSNVTFYPMIRIASDPDNTYEPYAKTNQQLTKDSVTWDNLSEVGAVNLLQNNATTQTINGVTFTVNSDGTIIANGANTSTSAFGYEINAVGDNFVLPAGSYKLTGCPSNGGDKTWRLQAYKTDGTTVVAIDNGNGAMFTLTEPTQLIVKIRIGGSAGSGTLTNLVFKPMITPVSYNGPYVPYAKSNKELTDFVSDMETLTDTTQITVADSSALAINDVTLTKKGNVLCGFVSIQCKTALQYNTTLFTLPAGFRPSAFCNIIGVEQNTINGEINMFGLWSSGSVQLQNGVASASKNYRIQIIGII